MAADHERGGKKASGGTNAPTNPEMVVSGSARRIT